MIRKYFQPIDNVTTTSRKRKADEATATETGQDGVDNQLTKRPSVSESAVRTRGTVQETDEIAALLRLEKATMAPDWYRAFEAEMHKPYFLDIKRFLLKDGQNNIIYPAETELYSFTRCPLAKVKVVILGQDPYHGPGQAHGLCFSVKRGVPPPPSLLNIYKELEQDLGQDGFQRPPHGFLEGWTTEGVLLLNAALTVRKSQANSHKDIGWATFTDAIISHLNKSKSRLVFMLWGGFAKKKGASIDKNKHLVLTSAHPSPLSANKGGWFGCKHFSQANSYLKKNGLGEVNWNHLP
ncbi:hypothetical protein HDU85_006226 [Gaertneriomyces sp. JEL0708]|nr:hypothetical protein HDU85_006226 [Gaertneriomyces sp. JEL0708]